MEKEIKDVQEEVVEVEEKIVKKSTPKKKPPKPEVVEEVKEEVKDEVVEENVELESKEELPPHVLSTPTPKISKSKKKELSKIGVVVDCNKLRIREGASLKSKELLIVDVGSKLNINHEDSTESFYAVEYNGVVGFCLKTFINLFGSLLE